MRRETQNVVLLLVGGGLLSLALSGGYLRYVKPTQFPLLLAAGVVTVALAVVAIVADIRRGDRAVDHSHHSHHSHHGRSGWLLVLPVVAIYLIAPPALGADSVRRTEARTLATQQETAHFPPLPPGDPVPMRISDFVTRAGWDANHTLAGRTVALTGFVDREPDGPRLVRMVITCCAADAVPMIVHLAGATLPADDQWVTVTGRLAPGGGQRTPALIVTAVRVTAAPREPYEY